VTGQRFVLLHDGKGRLAVRYGAWSAFWLVGHVVGGAMVGGLLGWIGSHLPQAGRPAALAVLGVLCLLWASAELRLIRVPMPQWPRQVPRVWLGRLPWDVIALGYGVQLGSAVATRIKVTTTYAALACALLAGSVGAGVAIMAVFGAARAVPALIAGPLVASPAQSRRIAMQVDAYATAMAGANATVLIISGVLMVWTAWLAIAAVGRP
jgi:hypothetical protein